MTEERPQSATRATTDRFYLRSAWAIAALIVLSFPQTYYLPVATGERHFIALRHLHGLAFFAFTGLFVWQATLVSRRQIARHREWGTFGTAIAGAMLPLGLWLAVTAIGERIGARSTRPFETSLYNLVDIILFCGFIGWSIREAWHRIDWHRRLAFIAMLNLLGPAASRWVLQLPLAFPWLDMAPNLLADCGLVVLAIHDRRRDGRVHPVTLTAIVVMVPLHIAEPLIGRSEWWNAFARGLFGFG